MKKIVTILILAIVLHSYSNIVQSISKPTLTTSVSTNISQNEATYEGNVTSDGVANVALKDMAWSTPQNLNINLST
jgi:hypothetical protein